MYHLTSMIHKMVFALSLLRGVQTFRFDRIRKISSLRASELPNGNEYVAGVVFDFETTSADPKTTEPVQLAVLCVNSRHDVAPSFVRYIMPIGDIEPGAEEVHKISKELLLRKGGDCSFPKTCASNQARN